MNSWFQLLGALLLSLMLVACGGSSDSSTGGSVSDAEFKLACDNGVTLCKDDSKHKLTFGAQDCSTTAIEAAYSSCDSGCRSKAKPIIDCQKAATSCDAFAACLQ